MAIYHCSMQSISRGVGQSIVASAAYRHACRLENTRTGEVHDYTNKKGLESSAIYLPSGVNVEWSTDRGQLWNAVEAAEKRKNSRLGRDLVLALPSELSAVQRRELTEEMARHLADKYKIAVDVAIHQPSHQGDQRNHHAHMLMSSRRITSQGFGEKARELDDKTRGPVEVEHIRLTWANMANCALEKAGQHVQIDHRSLKAQGVKRLPTIHLGSSASAMERRGIKTRLGERNRAACLFSKEIANKQWHEKWIKCQEEIHKSKATEKTQVSVVRYEETHEELEERLYGKIERNKNTSETYLEDLYSYKIELKNKKNTEEKNQFVKTDIELIKEYNELGNICYTKEELEFMSNYAFNYIHKPSDKELLIANKRLEIAKESLQKFEENKKEIGFFSKLWNKTDLEDEKCKLFCDIKNAEYEYSRQKVFFEEATKKFNNMKVVLKIKEDRKREASERQAAAMKRPEMKAALVRKEQEDKELQCQQKQQGQYRGR